MPGKITSTDHELTAIQFIEALSAHKSKSELANVQRYFQYEGMESKFLGIKMATIFKLAKECMQMSLSEIAKLIESEYYEARMGAVSIMDFQAREKKTTATKKKELFDLYISKHRHINNWDLVDRAAPYVVGGYLIDKSRKILTALAKSANVWERRTAIVSTYLFIRQNEVDETFRIAELLVNDQHDGINKAVGSWVREAGKRDKQKLLKFLNKYAATMPRVTLRYAIEKLSKEEKEFYMGLHKSA